MKKIKIAVATVALSLSLVPGLVLAGGNQSEIIQAGTGNMAMVSQTAAGVVDPATANMSGIYQVGDLNMAMHTQVSDGSGLMNVAFTYQGDVAGDSNSNVSIITQGFGANTTAGGNQARVQQDNATLSAHDAFDYSVITLVP